MELRVDPALAAGRDRHGPSSVEDAVDAIRRGGIVVVVDDEDREDEGDFVVAAAHADAAAVNFMVTEGRGLLCLAMTAERLAELELGPLVPEAGGSESTAFTVSIDLDDGSTGISAAARARTIAAALDPATRPSDLRRPGHVFPLRARRGGVLERPGHTEAAVDLARLAGLRPAGVICEIMNPDGTMARLPDLLRVAARHDLPLVTVADLVAYRNRAEAAVVRLAEAAIPTASGELRAIAYGAADGTEHVAVVAGEPSGRSDVLVRVHSECLTGDVLGSLRCDCGSQLRASLHAIADAGCGVVVYLRGHEGRGIGLADKLRAYRLQDRGADTVEANAALGYPADLRLYDAAAGIVRDLGVASVRLMTNNPEKRAALERHGVPVTGRVPLETTPTAHNLRYLTTKRDALGHELRLA